MKTTTPPKRIVFVTAISLILPLSGHCFFHPAHQRSATLGTECDYCPGEVLRTTGPMAKANPLGFPTKGQDDEAALLYYGYRYYNASTGRWLSRDPAEEKAGLSLFRFVDNNPIGGVDRLGLLTIEVQGSPRQKTCGGFEVSWRFTLDHAAPAGAPPAGGGLILQMITFKRNYAACGKQPVMKQELQYEGWIVDGGQSSPKMQFSAVFDTFESPSRPEMHGTMEIFGEAKYYEFSQYPEVNFDWPAGIKPSLGLLITTPNKPPNWDALWNRQPAEGPAVHMVRSHWSCCCDLQYNFHEISNFMYEW